MSCNQRCVRPTAPHDAHLFVGPVEYPMHVTRRKGEAWVSVWKADGTLLSSHRKQPYLASADAIADAKRMLA